ncbi:hypothetical protein M378DRAFT_157622, partial [Amanita muscaria Koide BX008]
MLEQQISPSQSPTVADSTHDNTSRMINDSKSETSTTLFTACFVLRLFEEIRSSTGASAGGKGCGIAD